MRIIREKCQVALYICWILPICCWIFILFSYLSNFLELSVESIRLLSHNLLKFISTMVLLLWLFCERKDGKSTEEKNKFLQHKLCLPCLLKVWYFFLIYLTFFYLIFNFVPWSFNHLYHHSSCFSGWDHTNLCVYRIFDFNEMNNFSTNNWVISNY